MRRDNRAFTLIEILIVLVLLSLLGALIVGQFPDLFPSAKRVTARDNARAIQTALTAWMASEKSLSSAHQHWNSDPTADAPSDHLQFFIARLKPYLADDSAQQFLDNDANGAPLSTSSSLRTAPMADIGAYITLSWDHTDWRNKQPTVNLVIP